MKEINTIYKFLIFFLIFLFNTSIVYGKGTRFIVLGHMYPIIDDKKKIDNLFEKINGYNADYVFILGDSALQNKKFFTKINSSINTKVYFSPGNHELKKSKNDYFENVGYFNKQLIDKDIKFILINSSDNLENIKEKINKYLDITFQNGPTVLLTHHRIWDDTLISEKPFQHDKSFYFKEIYPLLEKKIDYIFSGNSKRQYFRDLSDERSYGKQNVNNIFWMDKIGTINAYSVGMGDGTPKANFVIVDVIGNELLVKGDYSSIDNFKILPNKFINKNKLKLLDKYSKENYFFINKIKFYFSILIVIILFLAFIIYKRIKKE